MHDVNGKLLQVGDEVLLRAKITNLGTAEKFCNVTIESVHPMPIEPYMGCSKCGAHLKAAGDAHNRYEPQSGQHIPCSGRELKTVDGRKELFASVNTRMLEKVEAECAHEFAPQQTTHEWPKVCGKCGVIATIAVEDASR